MFLLISFIIGDIFDAVGLHLDANLDGSGDFGLFDSRVTAMFLTSFGGFGALAVRQNFSSFVSTLFGIFGSIIFGGIIYYFGRFLYRQQASSSVTERDLIGRTALVSVTQSRCQRQIQRR